LLTALQRQIAEIIAGLAAAEGFGLAGGAALIVRGDIDRRTQDLDFFGLHDSDVERLLPAAEQASKQPASRSEECEKGPASSAWPLNEAPRLPRWTWQLMLGSFRSRFKAGFPG
jgi:hypothetical protein